MPGKISRDHTPLNEVEERDLNRRSEKGRRAEELMEDQVLQEAFDLLERQYVSEWQASNASERDKREAAYWGQVNIRALRQKLQEIIGGGQVAQHELRLRSNSER